MAHYQTQIQSFHNNFEGTLFMLQKAFVCDTMADNRFSTFMFLPIYNMVCHFAEDTFFVLNWSYILFKKHNNSLITVYL